MNKKYFVDKLPEGWQNFAVDLLSEGASLIEVLSEWGIRYETHGRFMKENAEYKDVLEYGLMLSEAWWTRLGRENINKPAKEFNMGVYAFHMKNRFNWRDNPVMATDPGSKHSVANEKIREAELQKRYEGEEVIDNTDTVN